MSDHDYHPEMRRIGVPDKFVEHGTVAELYKLCKMDEDSIYNKLTEL